MRRRSSASGRGGACAGALDWLLPAVLALAAVALPAAGGDGLEREFGFLEAEDIEKIPLSVVSRGPAIAAGQAPAVVDVITAEEIRTSGARTLAELLAQRVGIDVSIDRVVPRGLNTTPSGAGVTLVNHRTLLLIDGRPSNGLFFGDFLAGRELPLEQIQRIEIIRGPGSALYGTNAMAGVINVVTKDYADEPGPGVSGEYGSFSTRRVSVFAGAGQPRLNGNFFLRYFATGGANQLNRNDNQRQYFGFARSTLGPLTLEGEALDFAREEPGIAGAPTPNDHTNRSRYSLGGRIEQPFGEQFRLAGRAYANFYQTRLQVDAGTPKRAAYDERRVGEELSLNYRPFDWLSVTIGGEAREEEGTVGPGNCVRPGAGGAVTIDGNGCSLHQNVFAAFLEDQIALPYDVTLTAGFRYDNVSISGERWNPRVNLLWKPRAQTSFKVGYGEAFRAPSFFELRGAQQFGASPVASDLNSFVIGNPDLKPEVVRTVEGEIDHSFSREVNVRLSAFFTRGTNLITQQASTNLLNLCPPCGVPAGSPLAGICPIINVLDILPLPLTTKDSCFVNAVRMQTFGVEASAGGVVANLPIPGEFSYGVNYTFQDTKSRQDGISGEPDLPLAPSHKGNVLFEYRPIPELSIFSHTRVVGRQFADGVEKAPLRRYVNENVSLVYRLTRELQLGVGLYNVAGDDRHEALGVPREPRTVLGSVGYRFVSAPALPRGVGGGEEPPALGEARAAALRARAVGAESLESTSYREAIAQLLVAEELQKKGAGRDRVIAAAELSKQAAEVARNLAIELSVGRPTPSPTPALEAPVMPRPSPTARPVPRRTPAGRVPAGGTQGKATAGAAVPTPIPAGMVAPAPTPSTPPTPRPTPTPTEVVPEARVLLLLSDGTVNVYKETATQLAAELGARVELRDLHGDREQGIEVLRQASANLIVAVGSLAATIAHDEGSGRPVLFCAVLHPERYRLTGPSIGGVSFDVSPADQLEQLHAALPGAVRVGLIYDAEKSSAVVAEAERAAARLGLQIVKATAKDPRDVDPVFRSLKRDIDVLWVIPDSTVVTRESFELLALQAAESRIPFVAFSEAFARQGALLAVYPDPAAVGKQCAGLAARVLGGEAPSVQAPRFRTALNQGVADRLGRPIGPSFRPDVVIR